MARTRALLTGTERQRISGEGEDQRRYEAISRVRARIRDELPKDIACLQQHHPALLEELYQAVCDEHEEQPKIGTPASTTQDKPNEVPEDWGEPEVWGSEPVEADEEDTTVRFDILDLPGSGETLRRRQEAVRTAYDYLCEKGQAKTAAIREYTWENSETGYSSATSMWKNCVIKGLKQVAEQDEFLYPPGEGEHTWVHAAQFQ